MTAARHGHSRRPVRRGAVLLECVMVLPFLAVIVGLTFFFGWAMRNQQQVHVTDRYVTWRDVREAGWRPDEDLNRFMFQGRAGHIGTDRGGGPDQVRHDLIEKTDKASRRAGILAEHAVNQWPGGTSTNVSAGFPTDVGVWKWFTGDIRHRHVRDGVEWRSGQVSYLETIRDEFLYNLHRAVSQVPDAVLRQNLQRLYLQRW